MVLYDHTLPLSHIRSYVSAHLHHQQIERSPRGCDSPQPHRLSFLTPVDSRDIVEVVRILRRHMLACT